MEGHTFQFCECFLVLNNYKAEISWITKMLCRFKAPEIQAADLLLFDSFVFIISPKNIPERAIINISDSREADM